MPFAQVWSGTAGCPGSCLVGFWECTQMVTSQPFGRICSNVHPQLWKMFFFLCLIRISVFQFGATGHLWGEFIFLLYSSCQLFLHIYNVPLNPLFCRINSPSSTLLCQVFQPFHISALVCWICSTLLDSHFMPPLYWWVQNWTQHSTCVSQVLSRGEGSPSSICRQHSYKWVSQ